MCANPLEDRGCLAEVCNRGGGVRRRDGAPAKAGERVGLVQGAAGRAGQVKGLLVTRPSLGGITAKPSAAAPRRGW